MKKTNSHFQKILLKTGLLYQYTTIPFYNCSSLNSINIKSNKLKPVGNNAITGIKKNASIKCYKDKGKKTVYKKLSSPKTGYKDTMKLK